jgi:glutamyl-Q tRNA(Asp) synthetase
MARAAGGAFLLRIEDIDTTRCRPDWEAAIHDDLRWLGLAWPEPVLRQSDRLPAYRAALDRLAALGLTYPCTCTRRDIAAALAAPQEGAGPDGPVYPGTCRGRTDDPPRRRDPPRHGPRARPSGRASRRGRGPRLHRDRPRAPRHPRPRPRGAARDRTGDIVLARRDIGTSYHLAVVVDDAAQGITHVVRGADLFDATPIHRLLQALLDLPVPVWHHHRLIRDAAGRRLAKRDDARALARFRAEGATPSDIRRRVGLAQ